MIKKRGTSKRHPQHCGHECVCGRFLQTACVFGKPCPAGSDIYENCEHDSRTHSSTPAPVPDEKCYIITESELKVLIYGKYAEHSDNTGNLPEESDNEIYKLTHPVVKAVRSRLHTPAAPAKELDCCKECDESTPLCPDGCGIWLVEHDAQIRKAKRETVLDILDIELQEIKSRIESSAMGKPLSERERGRIIGVLDARVKLESLRAQQEQP